MLNDAICLLSYVLRKREEAASLALAARAIHGIRNEEVRRIIAAEIPAGWGRVRLTPISFRIRANGLEMALNARSERSQDEEACLKADIAAFRTAATMLEAAGVATGVATGVAR